MRHYVNLFENGTHYVSYVVTRGVPSKQEIVDVNSTKFEIVSTSKVFNINHVNANVRRVN